MRIPFPWILVFNPRNKPGPANIPQAARSQFGPCVPRNAPFLDVWLCKNTAQQSRGSTQGQPRTWRIRANRGKVSPQRSGPTRESLLSGPHPDSTPSCTPDPGPRRHLTQARPPCLRSCAGSARYVGFGRPLLAVGAQRGSLVCAVKAWRCVFLCGPLNHRAQRHNQFANGAGDALVQPFRIWWSWKTGNHAVDKMITSQSRQNSRTCFNVFFHHKIGINMQKAQATCSCRGFSTCPIQAAIQIFILFAQKTTGQLGGRAGG